MSNAHQAMPHKPEQEMELVEECLSYANDPRGFVQFAYPWGEAGTPLAQFKEPRRWQIATLEALGDHVMGEEAKIEAGLLDQLAVYHEAEASGRGIGKSALFGMLSNWETSCHVGASVVVTANTEGQLRAKTFPEFGVWYAMAINRHWWEVEKLRVVPRSWIANLVRDQLGVGTGYWGVFGTPWSEENPDAFAGVHNAYGLAVFYDEASGIPAPIWDVTEGFFTELNAYRLWVAFSQGRRNEGRFYELFHKEAYRKFWRLQQIDAREVEGTDKALYQKLVEIHGEDSDVVKVEVKGLFPDQGENQFISVETVDAARERQAAPESEDFEDWIIMGVDPAPRGRTAIRFRQGRDARTIKPVILNNRDNVAIAKEIIKWANRYAVDHNGVELLGAIVIDAGLGTGVIDYLKEKKYHKMYRMYEVLFGAKSPEPEWATMGTYLWAETRRWLENGGRIDDSEELRRDAIVRKWQWFGREDKQKILESKKDLAKRGIPSPDDFDSLALTMYPKLPARRILLDRHERGVVTGVAKGVGCDVI